METRITEAHGRPAIEVVHRDVQPGHHESWTVPIGTIAFHGELLGYADPAEALEAVIHILRHGTPDADPVTGKNVFTDAFTLLARREQCREDAAVEAAKCDGATSDTVRAESSTAAYNAVHQKPAGGGDCAMDACRREARRQIGLKEPSVACGEETRVTEPVVSRMMGRMTMSRDPDPDAEFKAAVSEALAPYTGEMAHSTREWLHELTDTEGDPLDEHVPEPTPTPEPPGEKVPAGEPIRSADEILAMHGGTK